MASPLPLCTEEAPGTADPYNGRRVSLDLSRGPGPQGPGAAPVRVLEARGGGRGARVNTQTTLNRRGALGAHPGEAAGEIPDTW